MQVEMRTLMAGLTGLAALSLGCGAGRSASSEPAPEQSSRQVEPARRETPVQIDNQNFSDMNIFLIDAGVPVFIGTANGLSKTSLMIPRGAGRGFQVRLLADPIGSSSKIRTPTLIVGPGQQVYWTIGSSPDHSFASAG
jgi:hypothetical protein